MLIFKPFSSSLSIMKSFYSHREKQRGFLPGRENSKQFLCCLPSRRDSAWRRWLQVLLEAVTVWTLLSRASKGACGEAAKGPGPQASNLVRSQEWTMYMKNLCIHRHSPSDCILDLGSSTHCASALYGLLSRECGELIMLHLGPKEFPPFEHLCVICSVFQVAIYQNTFRSCHLSWNKLQIFWPLLSQTHYHDRYSLVEGADLYYCPQ